MERVLGCMKFIVVATVTEFGHECHLHCGLRCGEEGSRDEMEVTVIAAVTAVTAGVEILRSWHPLDFLYLPPSTSPTSFHLTTTLRNLFSSNHPRHPSWVSSIDTIIDC